MSEHRTEIVSVRLEPPLRLYVEQKAKRERRTLTATIATLVAAALTPPRARSMTIVVSPATVISAAGRHPRDDGTTTRGRGTYGQRASTPGVRRTIDVASPQVTRQSGLAYSPVSASSWTRPLSTLPPWWRRCSPWPSTRCWEPPVLPRTARAWKSNWRVPVPPYGGYAKPRSRPKPTTSPRAGVPTSRS
jgi:hypothetical protein